MEVRAPTVFGRVRGLGRWRDFARRRSVVANLMQEVDGFTDQQNLGGENVIRGKQRPGYNHLIKKSHCL